MERIRHGIAVPGSMLMADTERPLTPRGVSAAQAAQGCRLKIRFDRLYHSPWRRAVETAELLAPVLAGKAVDSPALARAPSQDLLEILAGERVALVGHEPWLGELVAWLTTGAPSDGSAFAFKRGGVAWLEGPPQPGQMVLQAFLPPRVLRTLGGAAR